MSDGSMEKGKMSRRKMLKVMGASMLSIAAGSALINNAYSTASASASAAEAVQPTEPAALPTAAISFYNVKDYGAVGNGIANDTDAIQTALTLAAGVEGKASMVFIPKGTYLVTDTLRIYSRTHLKLDQGTTMVRNHDRSFLINGDWNANYTGYDGQGHFIVEGGVWDGNINQYPNMFNWFGLARARNVVFRDVEVRDVVSAHAIDMNACEDILIENCRFLGYRDGTSDQSRNYAEAIQIANHTETGFNDMGSFDGTPSRNVRIMNCYFGASGTAGTGPWASGVGNHYAVHNLYNSDIVIEGNTFDGMTYSGVRSFKFAGLIVANNTFLNCHKGIMLSNPAANTESTKDAAGVQSGLPQSSHNVIIHSNVFKGTTGDSIYCVGWPKSNSVYAKVEALSITDNIFDTNSANNSCITMKWVNNALILNNQFRNVYRGIYLAYGTGVAITGNHMSDIKVEGIFIEEPDTEYAGVGHTANIRITDNTLKQCGRSAINLRALKHFQVNDNLIEAAGIESDNSRQGIAVSSAASEGRIAGNAVIPAAVGNKNQYGIQVTSTCINVQVADNRLEGKSGRVSIEGSTNFEGIYMHSPNGNRYRVTVSNSGTPVYTEA
jgi:hypothetical protein